MNYWHEKGAAKNKLVMGMPMYGQSFSLNDPSNTKLHSKATKGNPGPFTRAAGFLAYYEVSLSLFCNLGFTFGAIGFITDLLVP